MWIKTPPQEGCGEIKTSLADHLSAYATFCPQVAKRKNAALNLKALFYVCVFTDSYDAFL